MRKESHAKENQRISMRIDLEVLNSVDLIITTSTSDSECMSETEKKRVRQSGREAETEGNHSRDSS